MLILLSVPFDPSWKEASWLHGMCLSTALMLRPPRAAPTSSSQYCRSSNLIQLMFPEMLRLRKSAENKNTKSVERHEGQKGQRFLVGMFLSWSHKLQKKANYIRRLASDQDIGTRRAGCSQQTMSTSHDWHDHSPRGRSQAESPGAGAAADADATACDVLCSFPCLKQSISNICTNHLLGVGEKHAVSTKHIHIPPFGDFREKMAFLKNLLNFCSFEGQGEERVTERQ